MSETPWHMRTATDGEVARLAAETLKISCRWNIHVRRVVLY
jgi:hypothetical protein